MVSPYTPQASPQSLWAGLGLVPTPLWLALSLSGLASGWFPHPFGWPSVSLGWPQAGSHTPFADSQAGFHAPWAGPLTPQARPLTDGRTEFLFILLPSYPLNPRAMPLGQMDGRNFSSFH